MVGLKKYNLAAEEIGEVEISDRCVDIEINGQLVKDYIVAIRNNARQWSACTKGRSEVCHSNQKPHKQKGLGRARQGSLAAAQYRGGGVVFGPKPKFDQHTRINRKERRLAINSLLAEKVKTGEMIVLEDINLDAPKTKTVANFIKICNLNGRVLFVGSGNYSEVEVEDKKKRVSVKSNDHKNFSLSVKNYPKANFSLVANLNGYSVILANKIVITESALAELNWLA